MQATAKKKPQTKTQHCYEDGAKSELWVSTGTALPSLKQRR